MKDIIVAKFGGSSLADSKQFIKVKEIISSDKRRRFIIPSAPGKRHNKDHKITDLLYMCQQLASHGLNFDEIFNIIQKRYEDICSDLNLDLDIRSILNTIKNNIQNGASKDFAASRGEYLNAIILSNYLGINFIDASQLIVFNDKGIYDQLATKKKIDQGLKDIDSAIIPGFYGTMPNGEIKPFQEVVQI